MSKRGKTEYECKCEYVIKGKGKEKKMVVRFNRIVTVPHCYPSVVRNTLETSIKVSVGVEVKFIVNIKGASAIVRGGAKVDTTPRTEVTAVVTGSAAMTMVLDTVVETMGGAGGSVSLVDVREAMSPRRGNVDMRATRGSGTRDRRKSRTRTNTRTSSRGITMSLLMTPFSAVVARAMEGGPESLQWMRSLRTRMRRMRVRGTRGQGGRGRRMGRRRDGG